MMKAFGFSRGLFFFFFAIAMGFCPSISAQSRIDSLMSNCNNAWRYGLLVPNTWQECYQALACTYSSQLSEFAEMSEEEALTNGFVSGYRRTRTVWKTTLGPDLEAWFERNEVFSSSYQNSVVLLLFHRFLNNVPADPVVVAEQL
ncbi:MAG: hypothetical protein AAF193_04885, partial [Bacteroidota bacterium]